VWNKRTGSLLFRWDKEYVQQGCQMVCFQTKNPNLGKFCRALDGKMLLYFMAIWHILRTFVIIYDHFEHFVLIWYIFYHAQRNIWQPWRAVCEWERVHRVEHGAFIECSRGRERVPARVRHYIVRSTTTVWDWPPQRAQSQSKYTIFWGDSYSLDSVTGLGKFSPFGWHSFCRLSENYVWGPYIQMFSRIYQKEKLVIWRNMGWIIFSGDFFAKTSCHPASGELFWKSARHPMWRARDARELHFVHLWLARSATRFGKLSSHICVKICVNICVNRDKKSKPGSQILYRVVLGKKIISWVAILGDVWNSIGVMVEVCASQEKTFVVAMLAKFFKKMLQ
jgi:hypothetical protein